MASLPGPNYESHADRTAHTHCWPAVPVQYKPPIWSPDGRSLVYQLVDATFGKDLWLLSLNGDRKTIPLMADPNRELNGQISPDGKWIAFANYSELVANEWGAGSIVHADCEQSANNYLPHPF